MSVTVDKYLRIAKITPIAPSGAVSSDTCDIYRLTADKPELIYKGASFGTTYVDPYPGFGDACGHRLVTVTANGDYATASGLGWRDADVNDGDFLDEEQMIIDVDGEQIELPYNLELSNKWNKDFKRTSYLGGSGTALCPYCGVDAVLGESAGYPLTKEFLRAMRQYWFETPVNANIGEHK